MKTKGARRHLCCDGFVFANDLRLGVLEHDPKKLIGFFDHGMLQLFEFERFHFDQMILSDWKAL
jgi:hypothetical protein